MTVNNIVRVTASLMCADSMNFKREIKSLEKCGVDAFHIDVMDANFVPNLAMNFSVIKDIARVSKVPQDVHLMVLDPERYVEKVAYDGVFLIVVHVEACKKPVSVLKKIRALGKKSGIALSPKTSVSILETIPGLIENTDFVLVMSVTPGFAGQSLDDNCFERIFQARKILDLHESKSQIMVDGAVGPENIFRMKKAGASWFVGGTKGVFLKDSKDYKKNLENLKKAAEKSC